MSLHTTNVLLGILAAMSVLEALAVAALGLGGLLVVRRLLRLVDAIERQHVAPAASRVAAILDDVKGVTADARQQSSRVASFVDRLFED